MEESGKRCWDCVGEDQRTANRGGKVEDIGHECVSEVMHFIFDRKLFLIERCLCFVFAIHVTLPCVGNVA